MNFKNEEIKHLDNDHQQQSFMKLSKEYAELSNFYMTQPLTPLDQKLQSDLMKTYQVIPENKTKLTGLFSPNNVQIKNEKK